MLSTRNLIFILMLVIMVVVELNAVPLRRTQESESGITGKRFARSIRIYVDEILVCKVCWKIKKGYVCKIFQRTESDCKKKGGVIVKSWRWRCEVQILIKNEKNWILVFLKKLFFTDLFINMKKKYLKYKLYIVNKNYSNYLIK